MDSEPPNFVPNPLGLGTREEEEVEEIMGYVVVISLPVILFFLIVAIACYLIGRARGREEAVRLPRYYGPPAPPVGVQDSQSLDK
ncbi:unnamed protein product [Ilex paraguariensis]|uniref:Uncharacterized protein n=1 Tax=Ilex paraguariensis TaxID=185542 RepID=A0ABC8UW64_9AQUA